jgi:hypothetical protein
MGKRAHHYSHDIHDEAGQKGDARPVLSTKARTDTSYSLKLTDVSIASQSSITSPVARSCLSPFVRTLAISRHIILPAAAATSSPPLPQSHHISLPYAPPHSFNARQVVHSLVATDFYQRQTGDSSQFRTAILVAWSVLLGMSVPPSTLAFGSFLVYDCRS